VFISDLHHHPTRLQLYCSGKMDLDVALGKKKKVGHSPHELLILVLILLFILFQSRQHHDQEARMALYDTQWR